MRRQVSAAVQKEMQKMATASAGSRPSPSQGRESATTRPPQRLQPITPAFGPRKGTAVAQRWKPGDVGCAACGSICCRAGSEVCFTCGARLKKVPTPTTPPQSQGSTGSGASSPPPVVVESGSGAASGTPMSPAPADVTTPPAGSVAEVVCERGLSLPADTVRELETLLPALGPVVSSLARDSMPTAAALARSAEDTLARFLAESKPCASVAERAKLEAEIVRFQTILHAFGEQDKSGPAEEIRSKLAAAKVAFEKLQSKAPSVAMERHGLLEARAAYERATQGRRDRAAAGAAKTAERIAERQRHFDSLRAQLEMAVASVRQLEAAHAAAHQQRTVDAQRFEAEVLSLFDSRLQSLGQPMGGASPMEEPSIACPAGDSLPAAAEMAELAQLEQRRVQLQQQVQALRMAAESADQARIAFEAIVSPAPSPEELPELPTPSGSLLGAYSQLYCLLGQWMHAGACVPFTFAQLEASSTAGPQVGALLSNLLGDLKDKWFDSAASEPSRVLPRQFVLFAFTALDRMKARLDFQQADTQSAAAAAYAVLLEADGKRRKLSAPGAD